MNNHLYEVFANNCADVYSAMLKHIPTNNNITRITHNTPKESLQQLWLDVFNAYYRWPKVTLSEGPYKAEHERLELPINVADKLIGNGFTFSMSSNTTTVIQITYEIPFEGDIKALKNAVSLYKRFLPIEIKLDRLILHFFTQKTIEEVAEQLKQDRNAIISLINSNQVEVDLFWETKKQALLTFVRNEVDTKFEDEIKKNELNNLLS